MRVLVTGVAGFIGSTTAELLLDQGHDVVGLDNLTSGRLTNVPARTRFVEGDCADQDLVRSLGTFDACVHFAARIEPGDSMRSPEVFFSNNVAATLRMVEVLVEQGLAKFVFSSSCAVYGDQEQMPIDEDRPVHPHSPYGQTKLMVEQALAWMVECGRLKAASLRYFNAAGATLAHPECHNPEIHLIPIAFEAALGKRDHLDIFGDDYATSDGTCVRDYVHVSDLAAAHSLAITALDHEDHLTLNLGTGTGSTNRQVVEMVKHVTGRDFDVRYIERRAGDPAAAISGGLRARQVLGWEPASSGLEQIVRDAWDAYQLLT